MRYAKSLAVIATVAALAAFAAPPATAQSANPSTAQSANPSTAQSANPSTAQSANPSTAPSGSQAAPQGQRDQTTGSATDTDLSRPEIRRIQQTLADSGYEVPVDGVWGVTSQLALQQFQRDHGLAPTGSPDDETMAVLDEQSANPSLPPPGGGSGGGFELLPSRDDTSPL